MSPYEFIRTDAEMAPVFSLYQLLDRAALVALSVGFSIFLSGIKSRYIVGRRTAVTMLGYVLLLAAMYWVNLEVGSRNAMVIAAVAAGLFYLANTTKPSTLLFFSCAMLGLVAIGAVGLTRGNFLGAVQTMGWTSTIKNSILDNQFSNEPFAAHMSLYGALYRNIPLTYGSSFGFLIVSIVPSIFGVPRPPDIYEYYSRNVGAIEGQGYTIHHATAWYLNFGAPGVVIGAVVFGWLWATLFNQFRARREPLGYWGRFYSALAFCSFTAYIPDLLRAGPEVYKSVIVECLVMPTVILGIAGIRLVLERNRPVLAPL